MKYLRTDGKVLYSNMLKYLRSDEKLYQEEYQCRIILMQSDVTQLSPLSLQPTPGPLQMDITATDPLESIETPL